MSAQALLSTSLYDGFFETEANMRNMGESSTTETSHIEDIAIKWNFEREIIVGAPYGGNVSLKYGYPRAGDTRGQYVFRPNERALAE